MIKACIHLKFNFIYYNYQNTFIEKNNRKGNKGCYKSRKTIIHENAVTNTMVKHMSNN